MNRIRWAVLAILVIFTVGSAHSQDSEGNPPRQFDSYWMVFLERGDDPPELEDSASADLQRKHLAHLSKVRSEGYALVAGPFEVPAEESLRGIVLYRGDLVASVRTLQEKENQTAYETIERTQLEDENADRDSLQSSLRDILAGNDMDPNKLSVMFTRDLQKSGTSSIDPGVARALEGFSEEDMSKLKSMLSEYQMEGGSL